MKDKIINKWFYSNAPVLAKFLLVYVKGDALVIVPLLIALLFVGFFNIKLGIIALLVFVAIRQIGEMVYWIARQFSEKTYRPNDFGLTKLDTNAIYILYQLFAIVSASIAITLLIYVLFF